MTKLKAETKKKKIETKKGTTLLSKTIFDKELLVGAYTTYTTYRRRATRIILKCGVLVLYFLSLKRISSAHGFFREKERNVHRKELNE